MKLGPIHLWAGLYKLWPINLSLPRYSYLIFSSTILIFLYFFSVVKMCEAKAYFVERQNLMYVAFHTSLWMDIVFVLKRDHVSQPSFSSFSPTSTTK